MANQVSDAAKRVSDMYNLHVVCGKTGHWAAFRLQDGTSDSMAYPSRAECVSRQNPLHAHMYLRINPSGLSPEDADRLLFFYRMAHENGYRVKEPAQPHFIRPVTRQDMSHWMKEASR